MVLAERSAGVRVAAIRDLLAALGGQTVSRELSPGDYVHHQGDFAETVSFIRGGQFLIEAYPAGGWEPTPMRLAGVGAVIGEEALLDDLPLRQSTVRALCHGRLDVVYRDPLRDVVSRSQASAQCVFGLLVAALATVQQTVLASSGGSAHRRIARLLLHGTEALTGGRTDFLFLTQSDLASLAGLQRPTANRVLKEFETGGCIEVRRGRIRVVDVALLERRLDEPS